MKKLIILLAVLPLVLSSCLKDDKDAFGKTASERIREVQEGTEKALTGAANGWLMEYYPSATQEYGGIAIYMKFQNGTVTVTSEAGGAGKTAESLYSYDQDYGPTINFDTYNPYFHIYSEPNSGVGPTNTGMGGDSEFIIMSYAADKVVLRGKKTQNTIVLTPLPETAWNTMFGKYSADVNKMDNFRSYELVLNGKTYDISREVAAGYNSRYFSVVTENGTIPASFIYTQDTGLKFYEPLVVDGVSIEEMTWSGGMFTDEVSGARIQETVSNNKFTFAVSGIKATSVDVATTPTVANEYYYFDVVPSSAFASASDEEILYELMDGITSMNQLSLGKMMKTLTVDFDTEYIPCAFGLKIVNGWIYPITELAKGTAFVSGQGDPMSPEYQAWLGTWTVTSTSSEKSKQPITFDITLAKKVANTSYSLTGWDISVRRLTWAGTADFKATNNSFEIINGQELPYSDPNGTPYLIARGIAASGTYIVSGSYPALTGVMNSDGTASVSCYKGKFSDGEEFTVGTVGYFIDTGGSYGSYGPAAGFTSGDHPVGPFKMVKKSAAGAPAKAAALTNVNTVIRYHKLSDIPQMNLSSFQIGINVKAAKLE